MHALGVYTYVHGMTVLSVMHASDQHMIDWLIYIMNGNKIV